MCFDEDGEKGGGVIFILKKKKSFVISMYIYEYDFWDMVILIR